MAVPIPTNPYVAALGELFSAISSLTGIYEKMKAQAVQDGKLTDADENDLHAKEDAAMASHPWSHDS